MTQLRELQPLFPLMRSWIIRDAHENCLGHQYISSHTCMCNKNSLLTVQLLLLLAVLREMTSAVHLGC